MLSRPTFDDYQKSMATASDAAGVLGGSVRGVARSMRNMGLAMTAVSGIVAGGMFALSRSAMRVGEAYREVESISSNVSDAQERYGDIIRELNTEFGSQSSKLDIIDGLYQSLSAGVDAAASSQREFLETATRLSVVGGTDLSTTVDVLSTVMNAYGQDTDFAQRASETLFRTVQFGKTRLEELAPVMGRISALGGNLGVNIEELGAAMSVLTRTGFESRIAATGLRAIMRQLLKPGVQMKETLRDIAAEQNFFADSMEEGSEVARKLAEDYRSATEAIRRQEEAINAASNAREQASLKIQEARLMQQAIEQDRRDEVESLVSDQIAQASSVEELNGMIEEYRLQQQKATVQEAKARDAKESQQQKIEEVKQSLQEELDITGNLNEGIGQFIGSNMGLVETLEQVQQKVEENNLSMAQLFPEMRGLQGVTALLGDEGKALRDIFDTMRQDGIAAAREEVDKLAEASDDFSQEEAENLKDDLKSMPELHEDMVGPSQRLRNEFSKMREALQALGSVFTEDVIGMVQSITGLFEKLEKRVRNMDEGTREAISRFIALASSIGLVLGPLLFFGGQLALIAGSLGTGLIPLLGTGVAVLSTFATAVTSAAEGGDKGESTLNAMQGALNGLVKSVASTADMFMDVLFGPLLMLGDSIIGLFQEIFTQITGVGGDAGKPFTQLALSMARALIVASEFIDANKEVIASFVAMAVDTVVNKVIPALQKFGAWIISTGIPVVKELWNIFRTDVLPVLVDAFNVLANETFPAVASVVENDILPMLGMLFEIFKSDIVPFITSQLVPTIAKMWDKLSSDVLPKVTSILKNDLVPAVRSGVQAFAEIWPQIEKALLSAADLVPPLLNLAGSLISLGAAILQSPIVQGILKVAIGALATAFSVIAKVLVPVINAIANIISFLEPFIVLVVEAVAILGSIVAAIILIPAALGAMVGAVVTVVSAIGTFIGMLGLLLNPITYVVAAVMAAILIFKNWDKITKWVSGAIDTVIRVLRRLPGQIVTALSSVIGGLWNWFRSSFVPMLVGAGGFITGVISSAISAFISLPKKLIAGISGAIGQFWTWWKDVYINKVVGFASDAVSGIIGFFTSLPGDIKTALVNNISKLWTWWKDVYIAKVTGFASDAVDDIAGFFGGLPVKIMMEVNEGLELLGTVGTAIADAIIGGLEGVIGGLADMIGISIDDALEWGTNLVEAIADGILDAGDVIKQAIRQAAGTLASFLPSSPADQGPLSKRGTPPGEAGKGMMQGIAKGMESEGSPMGLLEQLLQMPEAQMALGLGGKGASGMGGGNEININEKAVFFEEGAFQGVSDEELPRKVSDAVDEQLGEIIDRLEGKGKGTDTRK